MQMMNAVSTTSPTYKYGTSTSIPGNIVVKQVDPITHHYSLTP